MVILSMTIICALMQGNAMELSQNDFTNKNLVAAWRLDTELKELLESLADEKDTCRKSTWEQCLTISRDTKYRYQTDLTDDLITLALAQVKDFSSDFPYFVEFMSLNINRIFQSSEDQTNWIRMRLMNLIEKINSCLQAEFETTSFQQHKEYDTLQKLSRVFIRVYSISSLVDEKDAIKLLEVLLLKNGLRNTLVYLKKKIQNTDTDVFPMLVATINIAKTIFFAATLDQMKEVMTEWNNLYNLAKVYGYLLPKLQHHFEFIHWYGILKDLDGLTAHFLQVDFDPMLPVDWRVHSTSGKLLSGLELAILGTGSDETQIQHDLSLVELLFVTFGAKLTYNAFRMSLLQENVESKLGLSQIFLNEDLENFTDLIKQAHLKEDISLTCHIPDILDKIGFTKLPNELHCKKFLNYLKNSFYRKYCPRFQNEYDTMKSSAPGESTELNYEADELAVLLASLAKLKDLNSQEDQLRKQMQDHSQYLQNMFVSSAKNIDEVQRFLIVEVMETAKVCEDSF